MKTLLIYSAISLICFLLIANTTVTLKPFNISFGKPYLAIGWVFLIIGIGCIQHQSRRDGVERGIKMCEEVIDCKIDSINKN